MKNKDAKILSCRFNMDTGSVELKYHDDTMISIDCTAVESELDATTLQCSELDWLIYNKPLEYANLIFNGEIEDYIRGVLEHRLMD